MIKPVLRLMLPLFVALQTYASDQQWNDFFTTGLVNSQGESISPDLLDGKIVCIYFSAAWCGPCHRFTPKLVQFYEDNKEHIEVVFVSRDRDAASFANYMKKFSMPWLAVPWENPEEESGTLPSKLVQEYKGLAIPRLVALSRDGKTVISYEARTEIESLPESIAKVMRKADPKTFADHEKKRKENRGQEVTDEAYREIYERYRKYYEDRAEKYEALYRESLNPSPLTAEPEWRDLIHHHYQTLRQTK